MTRNKLDKLLPIYWKKKGAYLLTCLSCEIDIPLAKQMSGHGANVHDFPWNLEAPGGN